MEMSHHDCENMTETTMKKCRGIVAWGCVCWKSLLVSENGPLMWVGSELQYWRFLEVNNRTPGYRTSAVDKLVTMASNATSDFDSQKDAFNKNTTLPVPLTKVKRDQ